MIWIRTQATTNGAYSETPLSLAFMDVEYPDLRNYKVQTTQDGATIIQRPLRDMRPRKWIWRGYGPNDTEFAAQWAFLESLDTRARLTAGLPPLVGIWEDVSGVGGFSKLVGGARQYTTVRVIQVSRQPKKGGGPVSYESTVEFLVDDPTYSAF